jgi:hypothetical protein
MTHPVIRVADTHGGVFLHPTAVLGALPPEAADLHWTILDLREAFAPEGSDFDVVAIGDNVEQSATGLHVRYDELLTMSARLQQVIDGLFIGCRDPRDFPSRADPDEVVLARAEIVLAAVDSSFWIVSASAGVLDRFRARFEEVIDEDPSRISLSAWGR